MRDVHIVLDDCSLVPGSPFAVGIYAYTVGRSDIMLMHVHVHMHTHMHMHRLRS